MSQTHDIPTAEQEPLELQAAPPEPLTLTPILSRDKLRRRSNGTIRTVYTSGQVARMFFNRSAAWMQAIIHERVLPDGVLPTPTEISGERRGNRQWSLPDVEQVAFALFASPERPTLDAAWLLKVLDVVYATARLQGLLPGDRDPIADLRPSLR